MGRAVGLTGVLILSVGREWAKSLRWSLSVAPWRLVGMCQSAGLSFGKMTVYAAQ